MSMFTKMVRKYVPQARGKSLSLTTGINKTLSYGAQGIDLFAKGSFNIFDEGSRAMLFGMSFSEGMNFSSNIFSNTHQLTNKFQTGITEELSKFSSGMGMDQWGGKIQDGLKPRNIGVPSYNGATSPNMDWFDKASGNLTGLIGDVGEGLTGRGWIHDRLDMGMRYTHETFNHFVDFLQDPADKLQRNKDDGGGGGGEWNVDAVDLKDNTMRGAGTLKGRAATLKLNKGAKGYGRSSLKIGYGSGPGSGGGIKKWSSAQYASGHRTEN